MIHICTKITYVKKSKIVEYILLGYLKIRVSDFAAHNFIR